MRRTLTTLRVAAWISLGMAMWASPGPAQPACPRPVYDVSELPGASDGLTEARAINRRHQAVGSATAGEAPRYAIRWPTMDGKAELLSPASTAAAFGLSSNGFVAGRILTAEGERGAVWNARAALRWLAPLTGHEGSAAHAVNAHGMAVGVSVNTNGEEFPVVWTDRSEPVPLSPSEVRGAAHAINDLGQVVGHEQTDRPLGQRAVLWFRHERTGLPGLGTQQDDAEAIDSTGHFIAGTSRAPDTRALRAVLWTELKIEALAHPRGAVASAAHGVNRAGTVVGDMTSGVGDETLAVVWSRGSVRRLGDLLPADADWILLSARAINDAGEIVGYGRRGTDARLRAYVLRPWPGSNNRVESCAQIALPPPS